MYFDIESQCLEAIHCLPNIFCSIGKALTSSLNPNEVFKQVMRIIGEYFSPRNWSLLILDQPTNKLRFEIVMGVDGDKLKHVTLDEGEGIVGWVCLHGKPVVVEDASQDPRFSPRVDQIVGFTTRSVVCVPLLNSKNKVIGAIELINKLVPPSQRSAHGNLACEVSPSAETFTKTDMRILSAIGAFTGIAAENAFLHQRVKEMAIKDSLTKVYNRRYFDDMLRKETERIKRYNGTLCVLMIDIDDFKAINDTFGHYTGDIVLTQIAQVLKSSVRASDVVARFGGDEFVILMINSDKSAGEELIRRIYDKIEILNEQGQFPGLHIRLSIGMYAAGPDDLDHLIQKADNHLYQVKQNRKQNTYTH